MRKIVLTCILLFFYSSYGVSETFNQQIEGFDKYISEHNVLNWKSNAIDLKTDSKQLRNHGKKNGSWAFLTKMTANNSIFYKVIKKGKKIPSIKKRNITYKVGTVAYKSDVKIFITAHENDITTSYNSLPVPYQKLISIIGEGGSALICTSESRVFSMPNKKTDCGRLKVMSTAL